MTQQERIWLSNAEHHGGSFISTFARACFYADPVNFETLRPVLSAFMQKYPRYSNVSGE